MSEKRRLDLSVVCTGNSRRIYQKLAEEHSAIEPPIWGGLLARFAEAKGYAAEIVDQEPEGLSSEEVAKRVALDHRPRLAAIVVYGQQPSASTQNMSMAREVAARLKAADPGLRTILIGGHPSALPERTLEECEVDFVCGGEGPDTLAALLELPDLGDASFYPKIPGLWYREGGRALGSPVPAGVVAQQDLPRVLPGVAWEKLPMSAYRAHNWHCFDHIRDRKPYAALYTSLGCPFRCTFCCINAPFGKPSIRYWDPKFVVTELETLSKKYGVYNVKIADEMFVLNERHVLELCDLILERGLQFNFWAYARVDTVKDKFLEKLKKAGFNWLCLGIESGSAHVRDGVHKSFKMESIYGVVERIKNAGIHVMGNYIFGMPDDDFASMRETLKMALELNCEMANFYSAMAYPGSELYNLALQKGWALPKEWLDFSQHSYEQLPLPTNHLSAGEVLAFRDWAWQVYFTHPRYLELVRRKFGQEVVDHLKQLAAYKLPRKHAVPAEKLPPSALAEIAVAL